MTWGYNIGFLRGFGYAPAMPHFCAGGCYAPRPFPSLSYGYRPFFGPANFGYISYPYSFGMYSHRRPYRPAPYDLGYMPSHYSYAPTSYGSSAYAFSSGFNEGLTLGIMSYPYQSDRYTTPYAAQDYYVYDYSYSAPRASRSYDYSSNGRSSSTRSRRGRSSTRGGGRCKYEYGNYSRADAIQHAKADSRLESIAGGGTGWSCAATFENDITYATEGTSALLDAVVAKIRETKPGFELLVTSALGTASSPHSKRIRNSHYNPDNVKLDFDKSTWNGKPEDFAKALMNTGYFQFAVVEWHKNGKGWHIDAMFKPEALAKARNGQLSLVA